MNIKIITFNIRYDKPDPNNQDWRIRRDAIAALIQEYRPDIIGTQEGKAHQLLDLHRRLPNYQSIGGDRTGTGTGEHCAIFYNPDRLKCLDHGDFYLSDTPDIAGSISPEWGNPAPRMATWAVFSVAQVSKTITCFNTHLDYTSAKARELGARLIRDRMAYHNPDQTYLFLTGDFNAEPGSLPRAILSDLSANSITFKDALADVELEKQRSIHGFTGEAFAAVDTIYYDSRLKLETVMVDDSKWQGIFPSDHFPIIANFVNN
ncbi:MAG: endonuclease/exonuclease/phosphatase family protein [Coleofasciculus sp. C2-GNP5-27]